MPLPARKVIRSVVGSMGPIGAIASMALGADGTTRRRRRRVRRTLSNGERADIAFLRSTLGPTGGNAAVTSYLSSRR